MSEKDTRNQIEWQKYNNRKKYMGNFITKILCCLSRLDRGHIRAMDGRTRKLMTMHQALNPKSDIARV